jgi:hypothetical protein
MKPWRGWTRLILLCAATACRAGGPTTPEPSSVNVGFRWLWFSAGDGVDGGVPPSEADGGAVAEDGGGATVDGGAIPPVTVPSPLRYALAWVVNDRPDGGRGHWITTAGGPIGDMEQGLTVDLVMPSAEEIRLLSPTESVLLHAQVTTSATTGYPVVVVRPRIVIYEDVDEDGSFCPATSGCTGIDRVLGVVAQSSEIAAVLDVEATLHSLSVNRAQDYYAASGGRFTPFIAVTSETPARASIWQTQLSMFLDGWSYPDLPVECARISAGAQAPLRSFFVDIQASGMTCSVDRSSTCAVVALSDLSPPTLDSQRTTRFRREARCQVWADVQTLTVTEQNPAGVVGLSSVSPGACLGRIDVREATYVASVRALPPWWPCGTQIPL